MRCHGLFTTGFLEWKNFCKIRGVGAERKFLLLHCSKFFFIIWIFFHFTDEWNVFNKYQFPTFHQWKHISLGRKPGVKEA